MNTEEKIGHGEEFLIFSKNKTNKDSPPVYLFSFEKVFSIENDQIVWKSGKKTFKTSIQKIKTDLDGWKNPNALRQWKKFILTGNKIIIGLRDLPIWDIFFRLEHVENEISLKLRIVEEFGKASFEEVFKKNRKQVTMDFVETKSMVDIIKFFIEDTK
jgi:hypothetical protein